MAKEVLLKLPDDVHESLGWKKDLAGDVMKRLAAALYAERKISLGKAVQMSGISYSALWICLPIWGLH